MIDLHLYLLGVATGAALSYFGRAIIDITAVRRTRRRGELADLTLADSSRVVQLDGHRRGRGRR